MSTGEHCSRSCSQVVIGDNMGTIEIHGEDIEREVDGVEDIIVENVCLYRSRRRRRLGRSYRVNRKGDEESAITG